MTVIKTAQPCNFSLLQLQDIFGKVNEKLAAAVQLAVSWLIKATASVFDCLLLMQ
jgi:hypothetical protein